MDRLMRTGIPAPLADPEMKKRGSVGEELSARCALCRGVWEQEIFGI